MTSAMMVLATRFGKEDDKMYRQYEDPRKAQKMLEDTERELAEAKERGDDIDRLIDIYNEVESLRERVNFAWQDDEYDEMNASY